ncbi:MAG TPA: GNAT family N-acetyltransferase [Pyrinomonadaceae bacterium]|jgi:GNAT superfamily N-acetyltransferase|nr:GNAT family N-acetyltransferase [Pyrinomonadaceae bacterium]
MDVTFVPAGAADAERLIEFMREFYEFEHLAFDEPSARSALLEILTDDSLGRVWLIQADGGPAGYVVLTFGFSLEFHGRDAFLDELYIVERHRGRGIGKRAIEFVEVTCRALGVKALRLEVERANVNARAVYHKSGFKDHDRYLMTKWVRS